MQSRSSALPSGASGSPHGEISPDSVLNIPQEDDFAENAGAGLQNAARPAVKSSARIKTASEMLANGVGVIGVCCFGEEAEPKEHHREAIQEGLEDYFTVKGIDFIPPWIGILIALGAYAIFVLTTPKGKRWMKGLLGIRDEPPPVPPARIATHAEPVLHAYKSATTSL